MAWRSCTQVISAFSRLAHHAASPGLLALGTLEYQRKQGHLAFIITNLLIIDATDGAREAALIKLAHAASLSMKMNTLL